MSAAASPCSRARTAPGAAKRCPGVPPTVAPAPGRWTAMSRTITSSILVRLPDTADAFLGTLGQGPAQKVKRGPGVLQRREGLSVSQHEAVSKDGTRIPYFEVARKDMTLDGKNPTLLYGYGGFEISADARLQPGRRRGVDASGAASTWSPTSAAAASSARRGTRPPSKPTGRGPTRISSPWPKT